ncbi:MAG: pilus assembly PilX family protein [Arenimonas sp.]
MIRNSLRRQRGVSLIIVLLLLMIMTLLGLASLSSTIMQEKMSSNLLDRSIGFQAAEAALREAEAYAATRPTFPTSGACDANGLCPTPTGSATDRWRDSSTTWRNATVSLGQLNVSAPQYIIEPLGSAPNWPGCDREVPAQPNCFSPRYRITARSSSTDRALVILQVNYAVP